MNLSDEFVQDTPFLLKDLYIDDPNFSTLLQGIVVIYQTINRTACLDGEACLINSTNKDHYLTFLKELFKIIHKEVFPLFQEIREESKLVMKSQDDILKVATCLQDCLVAIKRCLNSTENEAPKQLVDLFIPPIDNIETNVGKLLTTIEQKREAFHAQLKRQANTFHQQVQSWLAVAYTAYKNLDSIEQSANKKHKAWVPSFIKAYINKKPPFKSPWWMSQATSLYLQNPTLSGAKGLPWYIRIFNKAIVYEYARKKSKQQEAALWIKKLRPNLTRYQRDKTQKGQANVEADVVVSAVIFNSLNKLKAEFLAVHPEPNKLSSDFIIYHHFMGYFSGNKALPAENRLVRCDELAKSPVVRLAKTASDNVDYPNLLMELLAIEPEAFVPKKFYEEKALIKPRSIQRKDERVLVDTGHYVTVTKSCMGDTSNKAKTEKFGLLSLLAHSSISQVKPKRSRDKKRPVGWFGCRRKKSSIRVKRTSKSKKLNQHERPSNAHAQLTTKHYSLTS